MRHLAIALTFVLLFAATAGGQETGGKKEAPAPEDPVEKALATRVNVNFVDTPLRDALGFVGQFAGLVANLDPELLARRGEEQLLLDLKAEDIAVRELLDLATAKVGVAWDVRWGGVFVATKERLAAIPNDAGPERTEGGDAKVNEALLARLREEKVGFTFDETPLPQALEFVRTVRSVNIVVDDAVAAKAASAVFSGSVHDCALADALSLLVRPAGFTWQIAEGVVFVTKPGAKPALKKAAPVKSVPRVLETTRLEAGFVSAPLPRVAAWIARSTKFPVRVDPWLTANRSEESLQVDLKTRAIPARTLLDLIAEVESLDWDVRWGGVFITTAERRKALPIDPIPARESGDLEPWEADLRDALAAKKVTLAVEDVSVVEVLALIRDSHGVNVLLAPKAAVAAAKMKATIAVEDVTLGDALSLLLLPRGLTYSLRHEVIVVEPSGK